MTEELKPIDVTKFTVTENGNVIRDKPEEQYGDSYGEKFRKYEDKIADLEKQIEELQEVRAGQAKLLNQDTERIMALEAQVEKGRNIVHKLLVVIQRHKWWNYTVIDEARAFMSEVDRDKNNG